MATTEWVQKAGMSSQTEAENLESFSEQAEASKDAAAASATSASASQTAAASSATAAAASEAAAAASEAAAETAETNAATSATTATTKASEASTSATNAATSETNAATSATAAQTAQTAAEVAETNAETAQSAAEAARDSALAALDSFDDRYLGVKATEPTVDNDGDALVVGALYFNSTTDALYVYSGSSWQITASAASGDLLSTNNLSDLTSAATARTNLGLGTAAVTSSTDYATAAQGALADSAVQPNDSPTFASVTVTGTVDGRDVAADGAKLDGIEANADVTDTANVTAAGALMDSEVTNLDQVKAFDGSDYATSAQGALADSAVQTNDSPTFSAVTVNGISYSHSSQENYTALSGTTPSIDADTAGAFALTTSGNTTFTFSSVTSGQAVGFVVKLSAGGTHTITWPASVDWAGGTAPNAPDSGDTNILVFYTVDGGTNWYGFEAGAALS